MDQIAARLWIGDANDGVNHVALERAGVTAVFNATPQSDSWPPDVKARVPYLRLDQNDGETIPPAKLAAFAEWMGHMMLVERRTVLVHCGAGISRAATFAIFWLMLVGWSWDEAEAIVRFARPQIGPHPALKQSVLAYLEALR